MSEDEIERRFRNGNQILVVRGAASVALALPDDWVEIPVEPGEPEPIGFVESRWEANYAVKDVAGCFDAPIFEPLHRDRSTRTHPSNPRRRK